MKRAVVFLVILLVLVQFAIAVNANEILPATVNALKFDAEPTFDGVITEEEWGEPTLKDVVNGNPEQVFLTAGAPELTWTAWLRWDSNYFYLALQTPDTKHSNRQEGANLWGGDCVQLKLDPLGNWQSQGQSDKTYKSDKAVDVVFALNSKINQSVSHCWNEGKNVIEGAKVAVKHENNMTSYEIAIPWAFLEVKVEAGDDIGLAIGRLSASNDSDDPNQAYDGCLEWGSGTILNRTDPAACGTNKVVLSSDKAVEPNVPTGDSAAFAQAIIFFVLASVLFIAKRKVKV